MTKTKTQQIYDFLLKHCGSQSNIVGSTPPTLNKMRKGEYTLGWFELIKLLILNKSKVQGEFKFESENNVMNITVKDDSYSVVTKSKTVLTAKDK